MPSPTPRATHLSCSMVLSKPRRVTHFFLLPRLSVLSVARCLAANCASFQSCYCRVLVAERAPGYYTTVPPRANAPLLHFHHSEEHRCAEDSWGARVGASGGGLTSTLTTRDPHPHPTSNPTPDPPPSPTPIAPQPHFLQVPQVSALSGVGKGAVSQLVPLAIYISHGPTFNPCLFPRSTRLCTRPDRRQTQ